LEIPVEYVWTLDEKPGGLVPGLVPGIQDRKGPRSLGHTCDQDKSLKFILIDSNFLLSPCPDFNSDDRCFPGLFEDFFYSVEYLFLNTFQGFPGVREMGEGRVPHV
jgi:hypothetical protein